MTERYEVLARLGSGGMATVLLCHDERLDRQVAVKRLHADSPRDVERRFLREAKLGASMNHPNLVSVYDTETDDEGLLIVMEHVEGESLADALRRGPLPQRRVVEIARELGEALDHVHAHGVVHRDVKPANVLLRRDGAVKLADLGIAVSVDQTRMTRSGTVLGSAAYMAPEQLDGGEIGPAADVYALAAVLFEALAGRKAREGRTPMEIAHEVATTPPPDLRRHAPDVPEAAAQALARGMVQAPAKRQSSAGELAAELERGLKRRAAPLPPPDPTAPTRMAPAARRSTPLAGALAVALIAVAVAAVAATVLLAGGGGQPQQPNRPAQPRQQRQQTQSPREEPQPPANGATTNTDPPDTTPTDQPAANAQTPTDPVQGANLDKIGFALMRQGDFARALPILRKAVASWPEDSSDIEYAYALYNLGATLNRTGHPDEAIPYLEKRLNWSNQKGVVKKELKLARGNARG